MATQPTVNPDLDISGLSPEEQQAAAQFAAALNDVNKQKEWAEAEASSNWMPEPGTYMCELVDVSIGTFEKDGQILGRLSPVLKILDETHPDKGKTFSPFMSTRNAISMGEIKAFVETLTQAPADAGLTAQNAAMLALAARGSLLEVSVSVNKKGYTNVSYKSLLAGPGRATDEQMVAASNPTQAPAQ